MFTLSPRLRLLTLTIVCASLLGCGARKQHKKIKSSGEALRIELAMLYVDKGVHKAAIPLPRRIDPRRGPQGA